MLPPDFELRPSVLPKSEIGIKELPTSQLEYLRWGNLGMVTAGLGFEMTNADLIRSLPEDVLSLYGLVDPDGSEHPEKITKLTGGQRRYQLWKYWQEQGFTLDAAFRLARTTVVSMGRLALEAQGWRAEEVDILVTMSSYTQDDFGYNVHSDLGTYNASLLEVANGCSSPAVALLRLGEYQDKFPVGAKTLIVGIETFTQFSEPKDLILFSDRTIAMTFTLGRDIIVKTPLIPGKTVREYPDAGDDKEPAFTIIRPPYSTEGMETNAGVIYFKSDLKNGKLHTISRTRYREPQAEGSSQAILRMNGRAVAEWMLRETPILIKDCAAASGVPLEIVKMIIPHQANGKLLEMLPRRLARETSLPAESLPPIYNCFENLGNSSSQTTLLALMLALEGRDLPPQLRIEAGDFLMLPAFGAGPASASALIEVRKQA